MAGVFQNIDPSSPSPPGECAFGGGGGDVRHSSVLYVCKYFVVYTVLQTSLKPLLLKGCGGGGGWGE
jgi:hypothetical protein